MEVEKSSKKLISSPCPIWAHKSPTQIKDILIYKIFHIRKWLFTKLRLCYMTQCYPWKQWEILQRLKANKMGFQEWAWGGGILSSDTCSCQAPKRVQHLEGNVLVLTTGMKLWLHCSSCLSAWYSHCCLCISAYKF